MKKSTPCLTEVCKISFQRSQSAKLCWKLYLRKAKQIPVLPEINLTRLFKIFQDTYFHALRQKYSNEP